jgi:hypothetical protein
MSQKADFSKLLKSPAGLAKKPPPIPAADYPAIIKSYEMGDNNKNKTPYVRFSIALTGWPEHLDGDLRVDGEGQAIDLAKKSFRKDFYFGDGQWRLDRFLESLGIEMNEGDGSPRPYEEVFAETIGKNCLAKVVQGVSEKPPHDIYNNVEDLVGE